MKKPHILYAFQRTGNGHTARAIELIPYLKEFADVDVLTSGSNAQLNLPFDVKYNFSGVSLFYAKDGSISIIKILLKNNFFNFFKDILTAPTKKYDLIVNDYEPITAWSSLLKNRNNIIGLSHQASLLFKECPKPKTKSFFSDLIIKYFVPIKEIYGFHFKKYHKQIFYPIIKKEIRELQPKKLDYYLVYLPSYSNNFLLKIFSQFQENWHVFSPQSKEKVSNGNCTFFPIEQKEFSQNLSCCKGVICGAGFELPAEALFLNKKLLAIPIKNQREQEYNALALKEIGVLTAKEISKELLEVFIKEEKIYDINTQFPETEFRSFIENLFFKINK